MSLAATRVGVVTGRPANEFTCIRCGIRRNINPRRRNRLGEWVYLNRATYKCRDCIHVEATERGMSCDESHTDLPRSRFLS
jgi:hypothetical protein